MTLIRAVCYKKFSWKIVYDSVIDAETSSLWCLLTVPPEVKISEIYKDAIPFISIILFVTIRCIVFPQLVTGLPNLAAG